MSAISRNKQFFIVLLVLLAGVVPAMFAQEQVAGAGQSGLFSIAQDRVVVFSQGNLQCKKNSNGSYNWRFADNQYDRLKDQNEDIGDVGVWFDLFGYGTSNYTYGSGLFKTVLKPDEKSLNGSQSIKNGWDILMMFAKMITGGIDYPGTDLHTTDPNNPSSVTNIDWGRNQIMAGSVTLPAGVWMTLSETEWKYLLNQRPDATNLRMMYSITTGNEVVEGLLLLPDGRTDLDATTMSWNDLKSAGAVFLPCAGIRESDDYSDYYGRRNYNPSTCTDFKGYYWSSTCNQSSSVSYWGTSSWDAPYAVHFAENGSVVIDHQFATPFGMSVRLVRETNIPVIFDYADGSDYDTVLVSYGDLLPNAPRTPAGFTDACYFNRFSGWNMSANTNVYSPITVTARYTQELATHTVTYKNWDGEVMQSTNVQCQNGTPVNTPNYIGSTPSRNSDECRIYTFAGWDPEVAENVTEDAVYTAVYDTMAVTYEVTFLDYDGDSLCYYPALPCDSVPTCEEPSRAATAEYSYTFKGWKETPVANANATYIAQYDSIKNEYEIVWKNWNGDTLCFDTITYGETPVYCGIKTPEKIDPTNEWTYTFKGWEPEVTSVTGEADYVATFDSIHNKYQVTWVNYNDTVLYKDSVIYGNVPVYPYADPECAATAQYTYEFSGWIPTVGPVTQDTVFKATYRNITVKYLVTWKNYNDTVLTKDSVEYGKVPSYTGETPTKNADAQFTYTFKGWKPKVDTVKGAQTYLAEYSETLNYYEVVYVNYNLTDTLFVDTLGYGSTPVYGGETPTKPADVQYTYQFVGWDPDEALVTGDALYVAKFDIAGDVKYGITWANYDGTTIYTDSLLYDDMPSYDQTGYGIPQKPSTDKYHFVWNGGWTPAVSNVKMNKTYTATFDTLPHKYEITWYNYDSTVLRKDSIIYDTMPVYTGQTPVKEATLKFTYLFLNQWNPAIQPVKKDTGYVAVFDSLLNSYKIVWKNWNDTILHTSTHNYGDTIIAPANPVRTTETDSVYFFIGWIPDPVTEVNHVNGIDTMFVAQYESKPRYYDVTVVLEDSTTHITGEYDSVPDLSIYQTTFTHCDSTYTFKQWAPAIAAQDTTPITYTAVYNVTQNLYTMTWIDSAGVHTYRQPYDSALTIQNTLDTVWKDNFIWLFDGWNPTPESLNGVVPCQDTTFVAQYHNIPRYYDVTYIYRDENESGEWDTLTTSHQFGTELNPDSLEIEKWYCDSTHIFQGWDPALVSVNDTSVKTFTAVYNDTLNLYTMTWLDSAGVHTYRQPYDSALTIQNTLDTVWKDDYIWIFDGWDPTPESFDGKVPCKDTTFVAQYHSIPRYYDVTYIYRDENESGEWDTLTTSHQFGTVLNPDTLETEKWYCDSTHIFLGWSPALESVNDTSVKTFTAVYNDTLNLYTMTWTDSAGVHTYRQPYDSALTIQNTLDTVWKDDFIWLFDGWDPTPESFDGKVPCKDTTFVAQYHSIPRYYDVTYIYRDENESGEWDTLTTSHQFGTELNPDSLEIEKWYCDSTHIFLGWSPALESVNDTSVKTFTAVYNDTLNLYTMTWIDSAGVNTYRQPYDSLLIIQQTEDTVWKDNFIWLFDGWDPTPESFDGKVPCKDTTFVAQYHSIPRYYDVTYIYRDENESGEWDTLTTSHQYGDILAPDSLTSEKWYCDSTHIFQGWDPALVSVNDTSVKTFTAVYNDTLNLYTMTWLDSAGVHTYRQPYDSALTVQNTLDSVWKDTLIWLFDGWDPTPESLNGVVPCEDTTFEAQYHSIPRYYDVTYIFRDKNESGEWDTLTTTHQFGTELNPDSLEIEKWYCDSTHIFQGWSPALESVNDTSVKTFTAVYNDTLNLYTMTWLDSAGVNTYRQPYDSLLTIQQTEDTVWKANDLWIFDGWNPTPASLNGVVPCQDTTFEAQYHNTPRYYDVTYIYRNENESGEWDTLTTTHQYGDILAPDSLTSEKWYCDSTHIFQGWDPALVSVNDTSVKTFTAVYNDTLNLYAMTWIDSAGVHTYRQPYDSALIIQQTNDTIWTDRYIWIFEGWSPDPDSLGGVVPCNDTVFSAQYHSIPLYYDVTYICRNENISGQWDTIVASQRFGSVLNPDSLEVERLYCDSTHIFAGWNPPLEDVDEKSQKIYVAQYTDTANVYSVVWKNWDNSVLSVDRLEYQDPISAPANPTRPTDATNVYFFAGWNPDPATQLTNVPCRDTSFVAQYTSAPRYYDVTIILKDSTTHIVGEYDSVPDLSMYETTFEHCDSTYTFHHWTPALHAQGITSDTYTAVYTVTVNKYYVTWSDYDGTTLRVDTLECGDMPAYTPDPTRPSDCDNDYTFTSWSPIVTAVTQNVTYTATYTAILRDYYITWKNWNDTVLRIDTVHCSDMPTFKPDPYRPGDSQIAYRFNSWTPNITPVSGDAEYVAQYDSAEAYIVYDSISYLECFGTVLRLPNGRFLSVMNDTVLVVHKHFNVIPFPETGDILDCDSVFTVSVTVYKKPDFDMSLVACPDAILGTPIALDQTTSDILSFFTGEEDQVTVVDSWWEIYEQRKWSVYDGHRILSKDAIKLRFYIVTEPCGDTLHIEYPSDECTLEVKDANADNCEDCNEIDCVDALYDWLLIYKNSYMRDTLGYDVPSVSVTWYKVQGDVDDLREPENCDDKLMNVGYYLTIDQNLKGTGDYYALVDVRNCRPDTLPCRGIMRSHIFHYQGAAHIPSVSLIPTETEPHGLLTISGLDPMNKTQIYIYDMAGKMVLVTNVQSDTFEFVVDAPDGVYRVLVLSDNTKETLTFIVK